MTREISKFDDVINSRDVIARIEDLEEDEELARSAAEETYDSAKAEHDASGHETAMDCCIVQ